MGVLAARYSAVMPLLVDCYNVLMQTMPPSLAGLDEAGLCMALGHSRWGAGGVVVVADGSPKPLGTSASPHLRAELIYSGKGRSADDVILEQVNASSAPRRVTVVTSDHALQKAVKRRGVKVIESSVLVQELARNPKRFRVPEDRPPIPDRLTGDEVDRWLRRFGIPTDADDRET